MERILIYAIQLVANIAQLTLFIRAVLSWFVTDDNSAIGKIYVSLVSVSEFIVRPIRNLMNRFFGQSRMDWAVLVAFFLVRLVANALLTVVSLIF